MPNSHRHARHDKTVLSVSRPLRQCQLDSRQLKAAQTLSDGLETQSTPPATTQTTLSCRVWRGGVNWALHDALIGAVHQRRDMIGYNCGTELGRPVPLSPYLGPVGHPRPPGWAGPAPPSAGQSIPATRSRIRAHTTGRGRGRPPMPTDRPRARRPRPVDGTHRCSVS